MPRDSCYSSAMGSSPDLHVYGLFAALSESGKYVLATELLGSDSPERGISIEPAKLAEWLLARGCEFCAHAVKLGHRIHCDHPPITTGELASLGFDVQGL